MEVTPELPINQERELSEETPHMPVNNIEPETVEMPDMALVLERLLGVPDKELEPESLPLDDLDELTNNKTESVLRTLHRVNLISLNPVDLMVIPVSFCEISDTYETLVDSGAEVNLISSDVVMNLGLEPNSTRITIKGLGLGCQTTVGEISLSLSIHGQKFPLTYFHVIPAGIIPEPVVIGYEFLKPNGITVDCARNRLSMSGSTENSFWVPGLFMI